MLDIKNLNINYNNKVILKDFSLTIDKGQVCTILGYSGCGKTSILNSIVNSVNYSGKILINNELVDFKNNSIEYVEQNYRLFNFKTLYENIVFGLKLKKIKFDEKKVIGLCENMGIVESLYKYPNKISGGQRQRAALLRSIITNPQLLLLDEPFSALDYLTKENIQKIFLDYVSNNNITCLMITHNIDEAVYLSDKIVILDKNPSVIKAILNNKKKQERDSKEFVEAVATIRKILIKTGENL